MQVSLTSPVEAVRLLIAYPKRWLIPAGIIASLAVAYAVLHSNTWEATQALIVRSEAAGNSEGIGRFRDSDEMKARLETVLELAGTTGVLKQTLVDVGVPAGYAAPQAWPTEIDVEQLREALKIVPPKGAEFGKTEVFYVKVRSADRARALALAAALAKNLVAANDRLRDVRAESIVAELSKSVQLSEADAAAATRELATIERQVAGDLAELRNLQESHSGESELRRQSLELETELRQAQASRRNLGELLNILNASQADQGQLLATPNGLLESQPALRRLKEGLLDAQMRTAELLGTMSASHPRVIAAQHAEQEIQQHLAKELKVATRGIELDWTLAGRRAATLEGQLATLRTRLDRVAGLRAEYARLQANANHRTRLMEDAQRRLTDARSNQSGAHAASLVSTLEAPSTGSRPVGPGRAMLALAGLVGGPIFGLGLLLLSVPVAAPVASGSLSIDRGVWLKKARSKVGAV